MCPRADMYCEINRAAQLHHHVVRIQRIVERFLLPSRPVNSTYHSKSMAHLKTQDNGTLTVGISCLILHVLREFRLRNVSRAS